MKICCYGDGIDSGMILTIFQNFKNVPLNSKIELYKDYEEYVRALHRDLYDMVIVTMNGAGGMEGVIASKDINYNVPVAWFSDDNDFSLQAFRMNIEYFAKKPINNQKIQAMLEQCVIKQQYKI